MAIVRSTIDLTHALGLRMVAEGVEDQHTLGILQDLGCDLVQGWHLGRPVPAPEFGRLLSSGKPDDERGDLTHDDDDKAEAPTLRGASGPR